MPVIVLKVVPNLGRWAVMHNDAPLASYDSEEQAQRAALALAARHPAGRESQVDLPTKGGEVRAIHLF